MPEKKQVIAGIVHEQVICSVSASGSDLEFPGVYFMNGRKNILSPRNFVFMFSIMLFIFSLIALLVRIVQSGDSFFSVFVVFVLVADAREIVTSINTAKMLMIKIFLFIFFTSNTAHLECMARYGI